MIGGSWNEIDVLELFLDRSYLHLSRGDHESQRRYLEFNLLEEIAIDHESLLVFGKLFSQLHKDHSVLLMELLKHLGNLLRNAHCAL